MQIQLMHLIVLGVGVVGFICLAASCGGNEWVTSSGANSGLWKICVNSRCFDVENADDSLRAVQAFSILSVLAMVAGVVASALLTLNKIPGSVAAIAYIVSGVCALIAGAIYAGETRLGSNDWGWSFILCWIGMILAFAAGILSVLFGGRNEQVSTPE